MTPTEQIAAGLAWLSLQHGRATPFASLPPAKARKPVDPSKQLLTQVEAARALGIDRRTTLADLIADKHLSTVPGPRGPRIPRMEVDRLVEHGIPARGTRAAAKRALRADRTGTSGKDVAAAIRRLPVH